MFLRLIAAAMSDSLGAPSQVSISNATSTANNGNTAGIIFASNGAFYRYLSGVPIEVSKWLTPQTDMSDYEIRATLSGGDTPSGTFDTWQSLGTTRSWELATGIPEEFVVASVLIEIRWTGNNVVQDSATYSLSASGPAS